MYNIVSIFGLFFFLFICWLLSTNKKNINWNVIIWGISIQLVFALIIFNLPAGTSIFLWINNVMIKILDSSMAGAEFIFGRLALPPGTSNSNGETSIGFVLAFQAFPAIIFFSALMAILYHIRIMPFIIKWFSMLFSKTMKISGAESLSAASNIFVGIESTFTIKPYLKDMTRSELFTVVTVGMTTVASNVLAIYVYSLKDVFPMIAGHLISASFLSAPAAIMVTKLLIPEDNTPITMGINLKPTFKKGSNILDSIINGANEGVKLVIGIVALLIAVLGLVALLDLIIGWLGYNLFDISINIKMILGYIFVPVTALTGVPLSDVQVISQIIGERAILTEITAYQDLAQLVKDGTITNPRSIIICTYALCGFAHVGSMAIFIGGISAIVPEQSGTLAKLGIKCLFASTIACLITGCVAGIFCTENSILLTGNI